MLQLTALLVPLLQQLNDALSTPTSLVDGFGGFSNLGFPGFGLVAGNYSFTPLGLVTTTVQSAYVPAVASQPNVITNLQGAPASISVSSLGVLLGNGQTFQVGVWACTNVHSGCCAQNSDAFPAVRLRSCC